MTGDADPLAAVLRRASATMEIVGPPDSASWRFARCWLAMTRYVEHGGDVADLNSALADFPLLPASLPGHGKLASALVTTMFKARLFQDASRLDVARQLVDAANADPSPLPDWPLNHAAVRSMILQHEAMAGPPGFQLRAALAELERHAETVGQAQPYASMVAGAHVALRSVLNAQEMDPQAAQSLSAEAAAIPEALPGMAGLMRMMTAIQGKVLRGDLSGAMAEHTRLRAHVAALPVDDPIRMSFERVDSDLGRLLGTLPTLVDAVQRPAGAGMTEPEATGLIKAMKEITEQPGRSPGHYASQLCALGIAEAASDDITVVGDGIAHLTEGIRLAGPDDHRQLMYRLSLGIAHLRRVEVGGGNADLNAGIEALEYARSVAGSVTHAYWTLASTPLAHAYRLSGRRDLGRRTALGGLRGHAWSVLLQPTVSDMHVAARHAAGDALDVARWCLADNDAEGAMAALEAGRCLIMHSAIETRDVESRLRAAGAEELARQWRQAMATSGPNDAPQELRRRVISALAGVPLDEHGAPTATPDESTTRLLTPPSSHEVRAALSSVGADALVYLLPGEDKAGAAVVVPVDEPPSWLLLPNLRLTELRQFDRCLADFGRDMLRGAGPATRNVVRQPSVLPDVCEWAWRAAIGPLLAQRTIPAGRPVRLVLVPMGELAKVPWQAARRAVAGGFEYALEHVVFSYAPSARLLCESAWRPDVPLTGHGLIVGDPDTGGPARDLPAARAEALAIHDRLYPDARYVGRGADDGPADGGRGDRADLLAWLTDPDGGSMAHMACHGVVEGGTDTDHTSYLLLHGSEHLAAEDIVDALMRESARDIALVVLAACSSGETGRGYDESFSLATAFLANRTRSVVSSQWSVPDQQTSVLMFLFHHYLRVAGLPPADALRAAQLDMIADRPAPDWLPAALRPAGFGNRDVPDWAGFIHFGR
jgi:hypothetical protein